MMESLFLHLVNMSITAGWLVLAVLVLRLVFRRAPKWIHCLLWVLVALRLIFPVSIESVVSLIPSAETVPVDTFLYETPSIHSGVPVVDNTVNPIISNNFAPEPMNSVNPMQVVSMVASYVWVLGMAAMALYALITTARLWWRVRESVTLRDNIRLCDRIATPFILGLFRPRIYLPTTLTETDTACVVAHEQAHLRRRDHWWKPLGFLLLTVYWFNPLLWVGYILLCRDIEAACDEKVIRHMDVAQRKAYSETLLACSAPRHLITACPLAFGETGVKSRIKSVLNYKKPAFWIIIAAVVATVVAAVCLLTNPKVNDVPENLDAYLTQVILEQNHSEHTGDAFATEAHTVFGTEEKDGKTVVYGLVLYEEYLQDEAGNLEVQSGSHIPTVITVDMEGNGYSLVEYWVPRDGSLYAPDIRDKFPARYQGQALDLNRYYDGHKEKTLAAARAYFALAELPDDSEYETYAYVGPPSAQLSLQREGNKAVFSPHILSSWVAEGTYERNEKQVIFISDDIKLVFRVDGNSLIFDKTASTFDAQQITFGGIEMEDGAPFIAEDTTAEESDSQTEESAPAPNVVTKKNSWQTLSHPMPYAEASKVSGGYSLAKYNIKKLQELMGELEWYSDDAPTADRLFDAYFSLDGVKRYYVSLDTWGDSGYLYDGERYATLPEEKTSSWDFLLADGGTTMKATHTLYGNYAEWNKAERSLVLDVVQADDKTLIGKKICVNTQNLYGRGIPHIGTMIKVSYDGTVLGNTVYAMNYSEHFEEKIPQEGMATKPQSGTAAGKVIFVTDKAVLLNCYDKAQFDVVWVRFDKAYPNLKPQMGEEYRVAYHGLSTETYPYQLTAKTMDRVSSTPLNNGFISEAKAIEVAIDYWKVRLNEPDKESGYYTTVYVLENPTADNPRYVMGSRRVDVDDGEPQNSALFNTLYIDAVTGKVISSIAETEPTATTSSKATTKPTTTTTTIRTVNHTTTTAKRSTTTTKKTTTTTKKTDDASAEPVDEMFTMDRILENMNWFSEEKAESLYKNVPKDENVRHLPVVVMTTQEELEGFIQEYGTEMGFSNDEAPLMRKDYNKAYFEKNVLLAVYYCDGSCSIEPRVVAMERTSDGAGLMALVDVYEPQVQNQALGQWFMLCSVKRSDVEGITSYTARVRGHVAKNEYVAAFTKGVSDPKNAREKWRYFMDSELSWYMGQMINAFKWTDNKCDCLYFWTFHFNGKNYYLSEDYSILFDGTRYATLSAGDRAFFRKLFVPGDESFWVAPY